MELLALTVTCREHCSDTSLNPVRFAAADWFAFIIVFVCTASAFAGREPNSTPRWKARRVATSKS
jgi:hypothetical protein